MPTLYGKIVQRLTQIGFLWEMLRKSEQKDEAKEYLKNELKRIQKHLDEMVGCTTKKKK